MKCNWCPNEIYGSPHSNGNSKFCSKKCLNEFYVAYPNQKKQDDKNQESSNAFWGFVGVVIIIVLIVGLVNMDYQNTTGEQVPETDVEQGYETEIYPEERYEPISKTNSEKIIKSYGSGLGWFQCDANNTYNWIEYNDDGSINNTYILQKEDDNYFYLNTLDGDYLMAIPKTFGPSFYWNNESQTFTQWNYLYDGNN